MKKVLQKNLKVLFFVCFSVLSLAATAQTGTISGKIIDDSGEPVIGATILVVGTSTGTVTDLDGNYSLDLEPGQVEISISYVGYLTETASLAVAAGQTTDYSITLAEDMLQLEDVVVIGYGSMKKSDLTGAVASVSSEDVTKTSQTNISEALQGRAAGVRVSNQSGSPGGTSKVFIRGVTSINKSEAMWVIDGVPGSSNDVNPNDVESIEILKDAATTAIYGASGGNGVVIVTTKKGKVGKTTATLNVSYGVQKIPESSYLDFATGPEFAEIYTNFQTKYRQRDLYFFPDGPPDDGNWNFDSVPTYDHQRNIFRTAPMQEYHLGVSGGNEKSTFSIGLGYVSQDGVLKNSSYDKISARINSDHQLNEWLKVGENISLRHENRTGFDEWEYENSFWSPITMAAQYHPYVPFYYYTDTLGNVSPVTELNDTTNWSYSPLGNTMNPIARVDLTNKKNTSTGIKGSFYAEITPIKGLSILSRITGNANNSEFYSYNPEYVITASQKNVPSTIERRADRYLSWQWQTFATYTNSLFNAHNFSIMAGYESGEGYSHYMGAVRNNTINETPEMWYFDASLDEESVSQLPYGKGSRSSGFSYFGRVSYDYKGIALGQINYRHDESSLFGPRNRAGDFLSYSVGLKFTEFDIVRSTLPFMNFGKIRWSAGEIGNNPLDPYEYFAKVYTKEVLDYSFNNSGINSIGASPTTANQAIHWEAVQTQNLGIDLGFLQNRLSVTAEWFKRQNIGMIMYPEIPAHAGFYIIAEFQEGERGEVPQNIGQMVNKGYELQLGWKDSYNKFNYSANFNYTYVSTEARDIPDTIREGEVTGLSGYTCWTIPNGPLSEFYGLTIDRMFTEADYNEVEGVITNQPYYEDPETGERFYAQPLAKPGDYKWKDINGDGKIDDKDIGPLGNPIPKHVFGFNFNASYGWFDLGLQLQAATGFQVFNALKAFQFTPDGTWNWAGDLAGNYYSEGVVDRNDNVLFEPNHNAKYARLDLTNVNENYTSTSSFYVEDGSYLKIQNIQLGVTLPEEISTIAGIASLRVYVSIQNLHTFTNYSGYDPEVGSSSLLSQGIDYGSYPKPQLYRIGANIKF